MLDCINQFGTRLPCIESYHKTKWKQKKGAIWKRKRVRYRSESKEEGRIAYIQSGKKVH